MRVVVVLAQPPLPEGGAPDRCSIALLRGLRAHGVEVVAIAAHHPFSDAGDPPPDLRVEVVPIAPEPRRRRSPASRIRHPLGDLFSPLLAERVKALAGDGAIVHLEQVESAVYGDATDVPSLVHLHYRVQRDGPAGWPWRAEFRHRMELALAERAAIRRHRYLVASSPVVAQSMRRLAPSAKIVIAPLSLEPRDYPQAALDGPPTAGIIGTAAWPPTASAVCRLVERVWPRVRQRLPSAQLQIGGRGMLELLGAAPGAGVRVAGEVRSAGEFLRDLSVLVYPLSRGSGMKVKVLESIATGLPVVTTSAGAEGIEAGDGVVIVEDDAALADATVQLLADPRARAERGQAARDAFMARYTPPAATAPLVELYRTMAASR